MLKKVVEALVRILNQDGYTNIVVNEVINSNNFNDHEKKLFTKLVYGVCENKLLIDYLVQPFISGKRVKPILKNFIRVGVYAIDFLDLKNHYIVNELVTTLKKDDYKSSQFLNGVLRSYERTPRRKFKFSNHLEHLSIKYSFNIELVELLYKQYKESLEDILSVKQENVQTYRINTLKIQLDDIKKELKDTQYEIIDNCILKTKQSLINSDLFKNGFIVAQDESSIKTSLVLNPKKESLVLDMCSAPGSKANHISCILENTGKVVCCDIYEHKLKLINENAKKLGSTNIETRLLDSRVATFEEMFDYILMDVPCSGLGVFPHKPDIKYQMDLKKIESIKKDQELIFENGLRFLKNKGILVYSTCTINKDENEYFINKMLKKHSNLKKIEEHIVLPTNKKDGFYICKMELNNE